MLTRTNLQSTIKSNKFVQNCYELYVQYFPLRSLKMFYLEARLKKHQRITILSYPSLPHWSHTLYQICHFSAFKLTNKPQKADAIIHFEDTTYRKNNPVLSRLAKKNKIINYNCRDISKKKVSEVFRKVFGYSLLVNPKLYKGKYVRKGNVNSLHNGEILSKPENPKKGYIYQVFVNTQVKDELVELRVPVIGKKIPFVYLKYRPIDNRFGSKNNRVELVDALRVISKKEYQMIIKFCHIMGLDCGELDVLRDSKTKKLYIVDANNTPTSPTFKLPMSDYKMALHLMSNAFKEAFLQKSVNSLNS